MYYPADPEAGDIWNYTNDGVRWQTHMYDGQQWIDITNVNPVRFAVIDEVIINRRAVNTKYQDYERAMGVLDIG